MEDFSTAIRRRLPGCPADETIVIARGPSERSSGRVGRSAAGKSLSDEAVDLAVRAHIRHVLTPNSNEDSLAWFYEVVRRNTGSGAGDS